MATQEFVRSLRADGMSEEEIRQELRGAGYKTGRISKLLAATRARGSADPPPTDEARPHYHSMFERQSHHVGDTTCLKALSGRKLGWHGRPGRIWQLAAGSGRGKGGRLFYIWESMACTVDLSAATCNPLTFNECGARLQEPEVLGTELWEDVTGLPRLYSKQAPASGWEAVQVPRWVQRKLEAEKTETTKWPKTCGKGRSKELCVGFSPGFPCIFSKTRIGGPARPDNGRKCVFCDPAKMSTACETVKGRGNVVRSLKNFRAWYENNSHVYNVAMMRVPNEWQSKMHKKALKEKRGQPRQPRNSPAATQAAAAAASWGAALASRKRAFGQLGSKAVTAYKKRRAADRTRVAKKFFLDNDLPKPMPTVSARAALVEQWCKFGSWAICKECRSLQPRPLEPVDTRRVAPAEMTAKKCKQCSGKHWVPQPHELPKVLRKLSLKMSKGLRPLDIDVGPVKKANNGYRIHSSMTRLSWSKKTVEEKIRQAR